MQQFDAKKWVKISIINLMLVVLLGILMRYKIGFEFPYFNQKNLQHAHSHFAFTGWVSQTLMVCMIALLKGILKPQRLQQYQRLLWANAGIAWGMLIAFSMQGYGQVAITFSTLSIVVAAVFTINFFQDLKQATGITQPAWFKAALVFNLLAAFGTFALAYMMASHRIPQHAYLASVYWFLHFQYNGWFFFACMGLLAQYINQYKNTTWPPAIFWWFAAACIPAYGLSTLWIALPIAVYALVVVSAFAQMIGWIKLLLHFRQQQIFKPLPLNGLSKIFFIFVGLALTTKLLLQLGSVIPEISKLAFGFRPIVIAYLHLVLLAIISIYLLLHIYINGWLPRRRFTHAGMFIFLSGVLLNELALGIQGIASLSYTMVPYINPILFYLAILMFIGVVLLSGFFQKQIEKKGDMIGIINTGNPLN